MTRRFRVLVVDDEPQITRVLRHTLEAQAYEVHTASDGISGFGTFQSMQPALVLTDLAMPNADGITLCKRVRSVSTTPIIVLSVKGEEKTKVEALDAGADDYLTKPFGTDELLARVRALLRRADRAAYAEEVIHDGDFMVNTRTRDVQVRGEAIHLTPKEYDLLLYLLGHSDRVLTQRAILTALWGPHSGNQAEYLRVFAGQLRKKIERRPNSPEYLKTEPWIGYRFQTKP
jgi:two-component system, OmpR family, KDP operon response regulator KdpE